MNESPKCLGQHTSAFAEVTRKAWPCEIRLAHSAENQIPPFQGAEEKSTYLGKATDDKGKVMGGTSGLTHRLWAER